MVNDPTTQIYLAWREAYKNKQDMQITSTHKPKNYKKTQKRQRQQERDETEQKFYKYGFWILLTAVCVNFILTQI